MSLQSETCRTIGELLEPWLDRELSAQQVIQVEEHLAGCASCRRRAERARAVLAELRSLPELTPSADLVVGLRPRLRPGRVRRTVWWRQLAAAAVLAAVGLGGPYVWYQQRLETRRLAAATLEARYALAVVARASATAGHEVRDGLAIERIVRATDRPAVRALVVESGSGG